LYAADEAAVLSGSVAVPRQFRTPRTKIRHAAPSIGACLVLDVRPPGRSEPDFQDNFARANISMSIMFIGGYSDVPKLSLPRSQPVVRNRGRAAGVIKRIRALVQKSVPEMERPDINHVISEVLDLMRNELWNGVRPDRPACPQRGS
jgi:hypothetical protein